MEFTASQVAELLNGKIEGDSDVTVNQLAKIEEGLIGSLTFLSNEAYIDYVYETDATICIIDNNFKLSKPTKSTLTLVWVNDARICFVKVLEMYQQYKSNKSGIDASAKISDKAIIGEHVYVGPNATILAGSVIGNNSKIYGNVYIGEQVKVGTNTVIQSGAIIQDDSEIGSDCKIYSGVIIGGDGFGFAPNSENNYQKVVHIGNVVIEDHVEIGANTTIDRGTLGSTRICKGAKLDNLIQIAHNVEIGENTVMAAQTGVAGSTKIGKNCMIGGQVGFVGHISIADGVKIAAQSGIASSIKEESSIWQGSPAIPIGEYKRAYVLFKSLTSLKTRIDNLQKIVSPKSN